MGGSGRNYEREKHEHDILYKKHLKLKKIISRVLFLFLIITTKHLLWAEIPFCEI